MRKVLISLMNLVFALTMGAQPPELTVGQHLEDYDYAVKYIEDNYAFWV